MEPKNVESLVDHFFRHETGKLTAVLTRIFGVHNLELAEDVVQDTLLEALQVWSNKGLPENQAAWLYKVAKNKALNIVNREKYKREYVSEVAHFLRSEWTANAALENLFSEQEIQDDQLRMMFTCCHPSISSDSQITLTLKTLCGFSIPEIAKAFLTSGDTINKRLVRARQKIRNDRIPFEIPHGIDLENRLGSVLQTIYLLFNEGYSASVGTELIRYELCAEAIRLAEMIASNNLMQNDPAVLGCLSLMYFNAARFDARLNDKGEILTMAEQNRSLWNRILIQKGFDYLEKAASTGILSSYQIMAAISAYHCSAPDFESTNWKGILQMYDKLLKIDTSPLVRLNRAIAMAKVEGIQSAVRELENMQHSDSLKAYQPYYSTLGDLYMQLHENEKAISCLNMAIALSKLPAEKELLQKKITRCKGDS